MSRYNNSGSSSNGDDNDYDDDRVFKLTKYCQIEGEIDRLNQFSGDYGQTGILGYSDVQVLDGMVYERTDDANKLKVFAWDDLYDRDEEGNLPEDVDKSTAPDRKSEKVAGSTYRYQLLDSAIEGRTDPVEVGDITMFLSNSSASRTLMKKLTPSGHDAVVDKEDDYGWMLGDLSLRDDLDGREVIHFHIQESFTPQGESEAVEFTAPVLLDAKTEEHITIPNTESNNNSSSAEAGGSLGGSDTLSDTSDAEVVSGIPDSAQDVVRYLSNTDGTDRDSAEQMISGEVDDMAEVDMDAVMAEIGA